MNHLGSVDIELNGKTHEIRFSNKALFKVQRDLKIEGLTDLFAKIEKLDLLALFTLLKHGIGSKETVENLMDCDVSLEVIATRLAEALSAALNGNKESD